MQAKVYNIKKRINIFAKNHADTCIDEKRDGAKRQTLPQLFCFYIRDWQSKNLNEVESIWQSVNKMFYAESSLPKYVYCGNIHFVLRSRDKATF